MLNLAEESISVHYSLLLKKIPETPTGLVLLRLLKIWKEALRKQHLALKRAQTKFSGYCSNSIEAESCFLENSYTFLFRQ